MHLRTKFGRFVTNWPQNITTISIALGMICAAEKKTLADVSFNCKGVFPSLPRRTNRSTGALEAFRNFGANYKFKPTFGPVISGVRQRNREPRSMSTNPFESPNALATSSLDHNSIGILASVRPAVILVAVAAVLFSVGSVLSGATAAWFYYPTLTASNVFDDQSHTSTKNTVIFAIVNQLIMACGFGYSAMLIFRHARSIRRATVSGPLVLNDVFMTQKSCWYCVAIFCAVFVILRIVSAVISQT